MSIVDRFACAMGEHRFKRGFVYTYSERQELGWRRWRRRSVETMVESCGNCGTVRRLGPFPARKERR